MPPKISTKSRPTHEQSPFPHPCPSVKSVVKNPDSVAGSSAYRGRLAPSPTGLLHLGHARTFWVAAQRTRAAHGTLLLRSDDLDAVRFRLDFVDAMIEDMRWLGLNWEEPMISQSQRRPLYRTALEKLHAS